MSGVRSLSEKILCCGSILGEERDTGVGLKIGDSITVTTEIRLNLFYYLCAFRRGNSYSCIFHLGIRLQLREGLLFIRSDFLIAL